MPLSQSSYANQDYISRFHESSACAFLGRWRKRYEIGNEQVRPPPEKKVPEFQARSTNVCLSSVCLLTLPRSFLSWDELVRDNGQPKHLRVVFRISTVLDPLKPFI